MLKHYLQSRVSLTRATRDYLFAIVCLKEAEAAKKN